MKLSQYAEQIKIGDKNYLYNYFSGAFLEISDEVIAKKLSTDIPSIPKGHLDILKEEGFVIDNVFNEFNELKFTNWAAKFNPTVLGITLINTFGCNFSCPYCYEKTDRIQSMNTEVADSIITFIKQKIISSSINTLHFHVLGGEPLLATDILDYIFNQLLPLQKRYNLDISNNIISNGHLLDQHIGKLKSWFNPNLQISFDGDKKGHNKMRISNDGADTFDKIFSNMALAIDEGINVTVRFNLTKENINEGYQFLDRLKVLKKKPFIYFGNIRDYSSNSCISNTCLSRKEYSDIDYNLIAYAVKNDIPCSTLPILFTNHCIADSSNGYVIDPNGDMYKCWHHVGQCENSFGKIQNVNNITSKENFYNYIVKDDHFHDDSCQNCKLLPSCMGGCPLEREEYKRKICHTYKYNSKKYLKLFVEQQKREEQLCE